MSASTLSRDTVVDTSPVVQGRSRRVLRLVLMIGGILVVIAGATYYWLSSGRWVSIDNAYLNADKVALSTDVPGVVGKVAVHEGEQVQPGQVLFTLDPRQFQIALDAAQADLAQTKLSLQAMQADYQRMLTDVSVRAAVVAADQATFDRYASLVGKGDLSRSQYDDARFKLVGDQQSLRAATLTAQVQLAKLGGNAGADVTTLPAYKQGEARVAEAQRQLDHATVHAPYAGIVTQVSTLQPGMFLPAGVAAFGLVSSDHIWVDANPKETELTFVKPGDPVSVTVDTYPGHVWKGTVESISPASGSEFSILPAQNASGNWVKVVQRIPLRVHVDQQPGEPVLRAGMSVVADIDTGHQRKFSDLY